MRPSRATKYDVDDLLGAVRARVGERRDDDDRARAHAQQLAQELDAALGRQVLQRVVAAHEVEVPSAKGSSKPEPTTC